MSDPTALFSKAFAACPLVAVLRGLTLEEAPAVGDALVEAGFTLLEVPLNSPAPYASISLLAKRFGSSVLVGAGTVLIPDEVARVADAGGALIVSPNTDIAVIRVSVEHSMISLPGYFTPTEGFAALAAGAHGLKLFPAEAASPAVLKAQRAVLPRAAKVLVVGGITPGAIRNWREAGADGFALGSNLYRPGKSVDEIARDARLFMAAIQEKT